MNNQEQTVNDIEQAYYNEEINLTEALTLAYAAGVEYADSYHDKL